MYLWKPALCTLSTGYTLVIHSQGLYLTLRRCQDMAKVASPAAARFPQGVQALLEEGLALRDRL